MENFNSWNATAMSPMSNWIRRLVNNLTEQMTGLQCLYLCHSIFLSTRRNRVLTKSSTDIPQWALVHRSFAAPKSILFMVWELSLVFAVVIRSWFHTNFCRHSNLSCRHTCSVSWKRAPQQITIPSTQQGLITSLIKASTIKGPAERKLAYVCQACSNFKNHSSPNSLTSRK